MLYRALLLSISLLAGCYADTPSNSVIPQRTVSEDLASYVAVSAERVLIKNVSILSGEAKEALRHQDIFIGGAMISAIGPSGTLSPPIGTQIIDGSGSWVMPGIIGMHNHTHMPGVTLMEYTAPRLYLAGGVTTMTTTGSADGEGELRLAANIKAGNIPGPTIFASAPYISGPGGNPPMDKPETIEDAQAFVDNWARKGVAWFKLYRHTDPGIAKAIIDRAHDHGLKVTGHLCSITYEEAANMGIDSLEHGLNAATDFVSDKPAGQCVASRASKTVLTPDSQELANLIQILVANDVTITSTLAILESSFPHRPQGEDRALAALSPDQVEAYHQRQAQLISRRETTSSTPAYWDLLLAFEQKFVAAGGHLVAGPDNGRHILPGYGDQRNFVLLVEAGFEPEQAVRIMTWNGAKTLGIDDKTGLIKAGYHADLLLIDGDIETNPSAIQNIRYVFKGGLGYDPQTLIDDVKGQVGLR